MYKDMSYYKRSLYRNVLTVERAIKKGVVLSKTECFDFLVKSIMVNYSSKNTKYHKVFNDKLYYLAECYAEALNYMIDFREGFVDYFVLTSCIKKIVSRFNKFMQRGKRVKVGSYSKNRFLFIILYIGRETIDTFTINSNDGAVDVLKETVAYCLKNVNIYLVGRDFYKFLTGYLGNVYTSYLTEEDPTPVIDDERYSFSDFMNEYLNDDTSSIYQVSPTLEEDSYSTIDGFVGGKILAIS